MVKQFLTQDTFWVGVVLTLALEVAVAVLVAAVIFATGRTDPNDVRWFAFCFVAPALAVRHFAVKTRRTATMKGVIVTLFVTFVVFLFALRH